MVGMSNHSRIVVGVAGRIGSGKSVVAHCLEREFGFQYLRYSMVIAEWFRADPADKAHLQELGGDVMAGEGQLELNRRLIDGIDRSRDVIVDGLRHPIDYKSLVANFGARFSLIFVDAPMQIRFERSQNRFGAFEQFLAADARPVESNIDSLRPLAGATISGTISLEALTHDLHQLVYKFRQRVGA
jgi:dephospho-CoA kinase